MPEAEPVIQGTGIRKSYGTGDQRGEVLRGVDLNVARGECLFLIGPSGSGKTTLLSILGCVLSADSGTLEVLGQDVGGLSATERACFRRDRLGFVFQRFHLFEALTAVENVQVPLNLQGVPASHARHRALELLSQVGLADRSRRPVTQMSMGQRQRVAVARALACDPEIVLADEPTASLDAESGHSAMELLRDLCCRAGKTVVVVSHDARIYPFADRLLTLDEGRIFDDVGVEGGPAAQARGPWLRRDPDETAAAGVLHRRADLRTERKRMIGCAGSD